MASKLSVSSERISGGNPSVYTLRMMEFPMPNKLRKCQIGSKVYHNSEKVIMLVGATGSGKTSLINNLVNYVFGVKWEDDFRYQLIVDKEEMKKQSQAESQTEWITAYTLYPQSGHKVRYTLTIIDTPGFGDTRGIKRDKEITEQIRQFFSTRNGIDKLDAVGFVAQASSSRLTTTQKFVFDSVLSLFGKDIGENIFLFFTFADQHSPKVLDSVKEANIPFKKFYKFNNTVLYAQKQAKKGKSYDKFDSDDDDDDDEEEFNKMFWKMCRNNFKYFFAELETVKSKKIIQTANVLKERKQLETYVAGIPYLIRSSLVKLQILKEEERFLQMHKHEMRSSKDFTHKVNVEEVVKEKLPDSHAMVCHNCKFTCHQTCLPYLPKFMCPAMNIWSAFQVCGVCPNECELGAHETVGFKYKHITVEKIETLADLKTRYENAQRKSLNSEEIIETVKEEKRAAELELDKLVKGVKESLRRLDEIALKKNPLSTSEYIDSLILNEQSEGQPGWQERKAELLEIRKKAVLTEQIQQDEFHVEHLNISA